MVTDLSVALLAGGRSTRMGQNKALVELNGRPLIRHVLDRVERLAPAEIMLITHEPDLYADLGLPCFPDEIPGQGALGGLYTALAHSREPHTLVIACDMPLVRVELLRYLDGLRAGTESDALVPRVALRPQGLLAIYSRACLVPIRACLDAGQLKVVSFYDRVKVHYLDEADYAPYDPDGRSFFNVNTPEDLATARRLIQDETP